jgi:hypothetical protein
MVCFVHLDDVQEAHQPQAPQRPQHNEPDVAGAVTRRHRHQHQLRARMAIDCSCLRTVRHALDAAAALGLHEDAIRILGHPLGADVPVPTG